MKKCGLCDGEGVTDNNPEEVERAPWSWWQNLKPGEDLAVQLGFVKPIPCSRCTQPIDQDKEPSK